MKILAKFTEVGKPTSIIYLAENAKDSDLYSEWLDITEYPEAEISSTGLLKEGETVITQTNLSFIETPEQLQEAKDKKIKKLKEEGSKIIQTFNNRYYDDIEWLRKSQNFQDIKTDYVNKLVSGVSPSQDEINSYNEATSILARKDNIVGKINVAEEEIIAMATIQEIENFDINSVFTD